MKKRIRNIIIIFSCVTFLGFSYCSQRVYAVTGIEEALIIGGGALATPEIVTGLLVVGGVYLGYKAITGMEDLVRGYVFRELHEAGKDIRDYVHTYQDSSGKTYVGLTQKGVEFDRSIFQRIHYSPKASVSTNLTVKNFDSSKTEPYMLNGYYMRPVLNNYEWHYNTPDSNPGYDFLKDVTISANDTLNMQFKLANGEIKTATFTKDNDVVVQVYRSKKKIYMRYVSYGAIGSIYTVDGLASLDFPVDSYVSFGYKTISNTVYVPGADVVKNVGIDEGVKDKSGTVAVPVGEDVVGGQKVYIPTDSTTWENTAPKDTVIDGLKPVSVDIPQIGEGSIDVGKIGEGVQEGAREGAREGAKEGTREGIREGIQDITKERDIDISKDVPNLDFSPLKIATQKFPFCIPWDIYDTIKLLQVDAESPKFHMNEIKYANIVILPAYDWDLAAYPHVAEYLAIFRWFEVLGFLFFLYLNTRDKFIRG